MTICITSDGFPPGVGGITTFNNHLISLLLQKGHSVIALFINQNSNEEDSIIKEGHLTKVILKKSYQTYYKNWQPYFRPGGFDAPNWIAMGITLREWLLKYHQLYKIDIIEVADYGGIGIFLVDAELPPVVITGHGSLTQFSGINFAFTNDSFKVVTKLEALSFIHSDAVITHSQLNKDNLERLFKREVMITCLPWQPVIVSGSRQIDNKMVVVGGLQPVKGVYVMAEAMNMLKFKAPYLTLQWIGGDTWLGPRQQKLSGYLKKKYAGIWEQNFIWRKEQDYASTQKDIASASLIIIPAVFETFNYVALEAASYKRPIIITNKTGASSLFTHGSNAWIIPADNPEALAEAIYYLSNNPEHCRELGQNAAEMVQKNLTPERIVGERISVYETVIQNRTLKPSGMHNELSFLSTYHTITRKYYYCIRRLIKKIVIKNK